MFEELKNNLSDLFEKALYEKFFSGAGVGISFLEGEKRNRFLHYYGKISYSSQTPVSAATFFDLASLTKPLATTCAILSLLKEKKLKLEDSLGIYFETKKHPEKKNIKIFHLLSHCSGLPAYRTYYKKIKNYPFEARKEKICEWILQEQLKYKPQSKTIYSDLGYILLYSIIEKLSGMSLEEYLQKNFPDYFGVSNELVFNPLNKKISNCAVTEFCDERKKMLCGEVHDENTFYLGGVSGHAGLFGTVQGVLRLVEHVFDIWMKKERNNSIESDTLKYFLEKKYVQESSWVLGFDTPSPDYSSAGQFMSKKSVGHLGFSGTSFWMDPEKKLIIILLTNRIHPSRNNEKIREFRPHFHNTVIESLGLR